MAQEGTTEMTPAAEGALPAPEPMSRSAVSHLETDALKASFSAIASANTEDLETTASAVAFANVKGDAHVSTSMVSALFAKQNATFQQGYASAVIAGGNTTVHQGGAPLIVGKSVSVEQGGGALLVGSDVKVNRGVVGVVIAGKTELSEDSKVLIGTKGALIIAAAILGGFGMVAIVMAMGTKRLADWGRNIKMPDWANKHEIESWLHDAQKWAQHLRKSA
jgi:hypothetical protein